MKEEYIVHTRELQGTRRSYEWRGASPHSDFAFRCACDRGYLWISRWFIPFGGMSVMDLEKDHPIRKLYLNRFTIIGLLSLHFRRYVCDFRERMYSPLRKGYEFAKKRFEMRSQS